MKAFKVILKTIFIIFAVIGFLFVAALIIIFGISYSLRKSHYDSLTSEFMPIFSDINEEFDNMFSYEDARYWGSSNTKEYALSYVGEDSEFIEDAVVFCNTFCEYVKSGEYDDVNSLQGDIVIKIDGTNLYLNCWYDYIKQDVISVRAATNVKCDYTIFQELNGIWRLIIVTSGYTEEQKEYAESFVDQCPFEIFISDEVPW